LEKLKKALRTGSAVKQLRPTSILGTSLPVVEKLRAGHDRRVLPGATDRMAERDNFVSTAIGTLVQGSSLLSNRLAANTYTKHAVAARWRNLKE